MPENEPIAGVICAFVVGVACWYLLFQVIDAVVTGRLP